MSHGACAVRTFLVQHLEHTIAAKLYSAFNGNTKDLHGVGTVCTHFGRLDLPPIPYPVHSFTVWPLSPA